MEIIQLNDILIAILGGINCQSGQALENCLGGGFAQAGEVADQVAQFLAGQAINKVGGHERAEGFFCFEVGAGDVVDFSGGGLAEIQILRGSGSAITDHDVAGFGRGLDGFIAFFEFFLRGEDGANQEIDWLGGTDGIECGADFPPIAGDGVTGHAGEFGAAEDFLATGDVAGGQDFGGEILGEFG